MPSRILNPLMDEGDPLSKAISPPPDESVEEKEARVKCEMEAKRVSDAIDDDLDRQRQAEKKAPKPVRVLLLGQSESGKSTFLKNFQLMHDPKAFAGERASWRAVIQLNVVRSIHVILDAMTRTRSPSPRTPLKDSTSASSSPLSVEIPLPSDLLVDSEVLEYRSRLAPLLHVEDLLTRRLTPTDYSEVGTTDLAPVHYPERTKHVVREVAVNSTVPWKDRFSRFVPSSTTSFDSEDLVDWNDPNDPGRVLHECADDMKRLWNHPSVQDMLEKQNLRLEEMAGFFLDSLDEVTSARYLPSNDHILRARLKTLGVSEHRIKVSIGGGVGSDWRIFDVGGHRSLRAAWAPYFDNMDSIIFLAPISAFDQVLAEAPKVNRLEDSVLLWTSIVANKLLQHTDLILFLNKCDIMSAKLASGIKLRDYVVSYGNRPNDFDNAASYLRKKFAGILKENSPLPRTFYCHLTSVTDTLSTQKVIASVKDMLMRDNLKQSTLLL